MSGDTTSDSHRTSSHHTARSADGDPAKVHAIYHSDVMSDAATDAATDADVFSVMCVGCGLIY